MPIESQQVGALQACDATEISNCAKEPIHIPGLIQPHGLLLVTDEAGRLILQVSNNSLEIVGFSAAELVDQPLDQLLGTDQVAHLRRILRGEVAILDNPVKLRMPDREDGRAFNVLIHKVGFEIVLEAEPIQDDDDANLQHFYQDVRQTTARLQATESEETLCKVVADEVRRIIGYDRVMVYRFDADWNGQVIAESQDERLTSGYFGLHFPASDVPEQARRIFTVNRIRCIPDAGYTPVGLTVGSSGNRAQPLDMSRSVLRSVSPVHLEYLRNMGVGATLTVSLLKNGKLWGLIACHHLQPKLVCIEQRLTCSLLGQIIESQLNMREEGVQRAYRMQTSAIQVRFVDLLARASSLKGLAGDPTSLLDFVDAQGAAIVEGTDCVRVGQAPADEAIFELVELIKASGDQKQYVTDSLSTAHPAALEYKEIASGMLAVEVSRERDDYILWFRPEKTRTVSWAGNPDKVVSMENGSARVHPRKSFDLWKQAVSLRSLPWKPEEVAAAIELAATCHNVLMGEEERTREIREREEAMRIARDLANSANIAMSEFLANMSHEIRTPMTAIQGYADLLYEIGDIRLAPPQRLDAICTIQRNSQHLLNIINDILDISKIKAGRMSVEIMSVNVSQLIAEVEDLMRQRAASKGLSLIVEYEGTIPAQIQTDSTRLRQTLVNLVGNAIKFTERGSVRVVTRFFNHAAPRLEIDVIDSGIGIPPDRQVCLFEPFVQADSSTTRRFGGTGLGLVISRKFAEMLGGGLEIADSQPGIGTTFRLTIATGSAAGMQMISPAEITGCKSKRAEAKAFDQTKPLAGIRLLLVEDCEDNQRLIAYHLKRAGAVVDIRDNGRKACECVLGNRAAGEDDYDVVLMDMQMPEMDGYQATAELRSKGYDGPIVALTAHAMADDRQKCLAAGCDDYITKPIDRESLIATIVKYSVRQLELVQSN